jgi:hypothetical protein
MKNIHVLGTDKPTFLHKSTKTGILMKSSACINDMKQAQGMNIYITSDEIVTKYSNGLYFIDIYTNTRHIFSPIYINKDTIAFGKFHTYMNDGGMCKKIILTTDQDLIKNGVQAIDDEFLEWFVKNPSCEKIRTYLTKVLQSGNPTFYKDDYRIIIPKEEHKCTCENGHPYNNLCCKIHGKFIKEEPKQKYKDCNGNLTDCTCLEDTIEMKQETLEEVRDLSYYKANAEEDYLAVPISVLRYISQLEQQERSYSEEDLEVAYFEGREGLYSFNDWFEQFKKK